MSPTFPEGAAGSPSSTSRRCSASPRRGTRRWCAGRRRGEEPRADRAAARPRRRARADAPWSRRAVRPRGGRSACRRQGSRRSPCSRGGGARVARGCGRSGRAGYSLPAPRRLRAGEAAGAITGARGAGALPLSLRTGGEAATRARSRPLRRRAAREVGDGAHAVRRDPCRPQLWCRAASRGCWRVGRPRPLHRAVGLRRGSLRAARPSCTTGTASPTTRPASWTQRGASSTGRSPRIRRFLDGLTTRPPAALSDRNADAVGSSPARGGGRSAPRAGPGPER